jgi:hypothetical protein
MSILTTPCPMGAVHSTVTGPGEVVITLHGRIDRCAAIEMFDAVRGLIVLGADRVTVDLSGAHDVDVHLLTALACIRSWAHLTIVGIVVPELLPALHDAQPDEAFVIYEAVR